MLLFINSLWNRVLVSAEGACELRVLHNASLCPVGCSGLSLVLVDKESGRYRGCVTYVCRAVSAACLETVS